MTEPEGTSDARGRVWVVVPVNCDHRAADLPPQCQQPAAPAQFLCVFPDTAVDIVLALYDFALLGKRIERIRPGQAAAEFGKEAVLIYGIWAVKSPGEGQSAERSAWPNDVTLADWHGAGNQGVTISETASLAFSLRRNYLYKYVIQVHRLITRT